uniref:Helicase ATP-binding domain-containing protein n=1 Tax=viral metagenome TaxID=1070528 RepID=A0A6C0LX60_9ZZZZ
MTLTVTIGKNDQTYYYNNGKRLTNSEGEKLLAKSKSKPKLDKVFFTLESYRLKELTSQISLMEKRLNNGEPETYEEYKKQNRQRMKDNLKKITRMEKIYKKSSKILSKLKNGKLEKEFSILETHRLDELISEKELIKSLLAKGEPDTFSKYQKQIISRMKDNLKRIKKTEKIYEKSYKIHNKLKGKLEQEFHILEKYRLKELLNQKSRIEKRLSKGEPDTFSKYQKQIISRMKDNLKRIKKTEKIYEQVLDNSNSSTSKCDNVVCGDNKICNPLSGRCVLMSGKIGKKILGMDCSVGSSTLTGSRKSVGSKCENVICENHKICNPSSGKCVLMSGKIGKKILNVDDSINLVPKSGKTTSCKKKKYKECKPHQYRDPVTNRCKNKEDYIRDRENTGTYKDCPDHQYRDLVTNRCKNKEGFKRDRSPKTKPRRKYSKKSRIEISSDDDRDCINRSNIKLRPHQGKVVKYMKTHDSILVVHGTGTGKTLSAVTISQCYLDEYPRRKVVFVGPTSLISNFKKELKKYGVSSDTILKKYKFYSFDTFLNITKRRPMNNVSIKDRKNIEWPMNPIPLNNKLLIVDEAHNMRNSHGSKSRAIVKASFNADKTVLLTATPFVNNIRDFIPLINMLHGSYVVGTYREYQQNVNIPDYLTKELTIDNLYSFSNLLRDKIDVVNTRDPENFPKRNDIVLEIPMTNSYYNRYVKLMQEEKFNIPLIGESFGFKDPSKFYHGYRRACQIAGPSYYSKKIEAALPILMSGKSIVYSNWRQFGVEPITDALKGANVSFRTFTGSTPVSERQGIVNDFNKGDFDVLVVTKAGGEGLDLVGVKSVVILDPTWNDAGLQQVIGRAIRYKSHESLPIEERVVNVYMLVLVAPESIKKPYSTGDQILYHIIGEKLKSEEVLMDILQTESI